MNKVLVFGCVLLSASILLVSAAATRSASLQTRQASITPAPLVSPMRIAEGLPGQVLVSDSREDSLVAVDETTGAPIWSFAVGGLPMAVGYASDLVFLGNATAHIVEVYRVTGRRTAPELVFQYALGFPAPDGPGNIRTPSDLDVDKNGGLVFVLDSGERRVKVFSQGGGALYDFPPTDSATPLLSPTAIALDPVRQEVLVSDYGDPNGSFSANVAARIMVYTYAGDFVAKIDGGAANKDYQFARPQGLGVDAQGRVFMAESLLGQVFVFDRTTGAVITKLGSFGDGDGQLMLPLDLIVARKSGDVLVTSNMRGRIEIFRSAGGVQ